MRGNGRSVEDDNNNKRFNKFVATNIKASEEVVPEQGRKKPAVRSSDP